MNVDDHRPDSAHEGAPPRRPGPRSEDPLEAWDAERRRAPVTRQTLPSGTVEWFVLGHPEALAVLLDPATFSSRVSRHLAVPSGMDPPEHARFREIVERYFDAAALADFAPRCREIVASAIDDALRIGRIDALSALGEVCAVRLQCAYLGWSDALRDELVAWQAANEAAVRERDAAASTELARAFTRRVESLLHERRRLGDAAPDDRTTRLLAERLDGRPLPDDVIVSMIRNWTVGELGSIAASIGILAHALAHDAELQARLRSAPELVPLAVEEVLRVRGPLVSNRRVATRDVELGGQRIAGGETLRILWPAVNRDERVFADPGVVRLDRDQRASLLWGAGIHVCPGAPLARLELRMFVEEILARSARLAPDPAERAMFAVPPRGGFARVPIVVSSLDARS